MTQSDGKRLQIRGFTEKIPCESGHKSVRVNVDSLWEPRFGLHEVTAGLTLNNLKRDLLVHN